MVAVTTYGVQAPGRNMEEKQATPWEREILADYLKNIHKEHVRERRWILFLRLLRAAAFVLMGMAAIFMATRPNLLPWETTGARSPHTAVIAVEGEISAHSASSADALIPAIQAAFENEFSQAIVLKVNSPGGSAVQSGRLYDEIRAQQELHPNKKVYAVIDDFGASGGYYVAMAAHQIYANRASLIGSIGVISSSFGFTDLMKRLGIERRTIISGQHKNLMDPFSPLTEETAVFWQGLLDQMHDQFIERVRFSRGDRLVDDPSVFSGLVWSGEQALELGLIDGLQSAESVARNVVGEESIVNYTPKVDVFKRLASKVSFVGAEFIETLLH